MDFYDNCKIKSSYFFRFVIWLDFFYKIKDVFESAQEVCYKLIHRPLDKYKNIPRGHRIGVKFQEIISLFLCFEKVKLNRFCKIKWKIILLFQWMKFCEKMKLRGTLGKFCHGVPGQSKEKTECNGENMIYSQFGPISEPFPNSNLTCYI